MSRKDKGEDAGTASLDGVTASQDLGQQLVPMHLWPEVLGTAESLPSPRTPSAPGPIQIAKYTPGPSASQLWLKWLHSGSVGAEDENRRESPWEGPSVGGPGVRGLLLDLIVLWGGCQRLDGGRRHVFVRQVDPKVFEVKLFGFYPSHFERLQAFGQLGVLPVGRVPWAGLHVGPGCGGARLIQPRQGLVRGERDAHPGVLVRVPCFRVVCVHHFLVARDIVPWGGLLLLLLLLAARRQAQIWED